MPTHRNIDGEESATVTFSVAAVELTRNSSVELQELLSLADPDVATNVARVMASAPNSTMAGVVVRIAGGPSSLADFPVRSILSSTGTDNPVSAAQSGTWNIGTVTAITALTTGHVTVDTGSVTAWLRSDSGVSLSTDGSPASTRQGLVVRQVGFSTTVNISSLGGAVITRSSAADMLVTASTGSVRVHQSTASDLNVTVAGLSTTINVSSVGGMVASQIVDRDNSTQIAAVLNAVPGSTVWGLCVREVGGGGDTQVAVSSGVIQVQHITSSGANLTTNTTPGSTAYALIVRDVVPNSTTVNVSSLAGAVIVRSSAANFLASVYQSTAADLNVTVAGYSTTVNVSSVGGAVIARSSAANFLASVYQSTAADLNVTVAGYSTTVNVSSLGGVVLGRIIDRDQSTQVAAVLNDTPASTVWALAVRTVGALTGSTQVSVKEILTSSGASVMDSTEGAIKVNVVAGAAAGSTLVTVRQSTVGDFRAAVYQSTAADLNVTVAGYSTTVNVSSLGGAVIVRSSAANFLASVYQSTAADLNVTVAGYSTTVNVSSLGGVVAAKIQDSSGVSPNILGTRPSTAAQGLAVRTILNDIQSTCFSTLGNNSTSATVVTSVAAVRHKVFAYSITSTVQAVNTLTFASSLANPLWQVQMQAFSSGISGANLAVSPPSWLFATEAASPLVFKVTGTTGTYHVSFSYFTEA